MKTKDISYSAMIISLFLIICGLCRGSIRTVQVYMEIIKIIVIAVGINKISNNTRIVFIMANFLLSSILFPISDALIYNVPSILGGYIIGRNNVIDSIKVYIQFVIANVVMVIYELGMSCILMGTDFSNIYQEQAVDILSQLTNGYITNSHVYILVGIFIIGDAFISATIIWFLAHVVFKRINNFKI